MSFSNYYWTLLLASVLVVLCLSGARAQSSDNQNLHELDEEEFVGFDAPKIESQKVEQPIEKDPEPVPTQAVPPPATVGDYWIEAFYVFLIVAYGLNYWFGKKQNDRIASTWVESVAPIFGSNFTKYGDGTIIKESNHIFKVYAQGRINCEGLQATLELKKRQDLFSKVTELLWKAEDLLRIDVAMEEGKMDNFMFAVVRKKEEKRFKKANEVNYLGNYSSVVPELKGSLAPLSESEEIVEALLQPEVVAVLNAHEADLVSIHFTDQDTLNTKYKKVLHFTYRISPENSTKLNTLMKMSIYMIDLVAKLNLSKQAKIKTEKNRTKLTEQKAKEAHQQRQEAAQQRKIEKRQKLLEKMTDTEKDKYHEKEQAKNFRKKSAKGMKVMKV
eukprot:TRINITY_DN7125_c0_g1_i1.p1 TRINITY_DN7125_c0_g1~~TRINITY_DN7125_c0_g1_i1.p1  ORF type:complete len:387 (+),score=99.99 TRINITY_DN7125_c0_g1_i1:86-1246(+)